MGKIGRLIIIFLALGLAVPSFAMEPLPHHTDHQREVPSKRTKVIHKAGWAGAGFAAGRAAGPAGSAAVGAAHYRRDLEAGGSRRTKAVAKIGAPIAVGAVAGPAGTAGYEVVEHRKWIKRHLLPHKSEAPAQFRDVPEK